MRNRIGAFRTLVVATAVLALGLVAGNAQAAFINGSISYADGFQTVSASAGAIVSDLNTADVFATAPIFGLTGAFVGSTSPGGSSDFTFAPAVVPGAVYSVVNGASTFTFTLASISLLDRTPGLICGGGFCNDDLSFNMAGTVDDGPGGLDPTAFAGGWTANGSCPGSGSACTGGKSASWSVSLTALGVPTQTPEPGSLILLGVGLLGLVAYRRRAR